MQELWNFALSFYAKQGVESACLTLQEQGQDVCLLICAAWLQKRAVVFKHEYLDQLKASAGLWPQEVTGALRTLRNSWKSAAQSDLQLADLREQIKHLELASEKMLLQRLESCCLNWPADQSKTQDWLSQLCPTDSAALQVLRGATAD